MQIEKNFNVKQITALEINQKENDKMLIFTILSKLENSIIMYVCY